MTRFQKFASAALVSVLFLIFVGAIVRVTGAGLGCPDWPKCWGCLIPPWNVEQVDLSKVDFEKFEKKAARLGRDPSTVTPEHILENFNPRHVWTEFINRLCALPVMFFSLGTMVAAFGQPRRRRIVWWTSLGSLLLVGANAVLGAMVVYSGLKPGVLTLHMALAMLLIGVLSFTAWRGTNQPWSLRLDPKSVGMVRGSVLVLLILIVVEGIMGTQLREMTDEMAKSHDGEPREQWIGELEETAVYFIHRSFSWVIVAVSLFAWWRTGLATGGHVGKPAKVLLALVGVQMLLGLIMAQIQVFAVVQVLHVGLAGIMLAAVVIWLCGTWRIREPLGD
ncbi:COX15/CtaA family protein [Haloferula sp.]|uniref:COX15/CtaA family protein n=1 Tax=Haloferula sp. TaxID=2497595 RepID=UPI003C73DF1D